VAIGIFASPSGIAIGTASGTAGGAAGTAAGMGATDARSDLHCSQNSAPSSLSNWQNGHFTMFQLTSKVVSAR
jgi:hypothetical protein